MLNLFQHPQILELVQDDILPALILELWESSNTNIDLYSNFYFGLVTTILRLALVLCIKTKNINKIIKNILVNLHFLYLDIKKTKQKKDHG